MRGYKKYRYLDACRYDFLKEVYRNHLDGDTKKDYDIHIEYPTRIRHFK